MPLARRGLEKGRKEVTGGELKRIKGSSSGALLPPALLSPEGELEKNHFPELPPFQLWRTDMKEGDILLQAGLGGSLHLLPGKFKGCNF